MTWTTPKIEEATCGMEINMYFPADDEGVRALQPVGDCPSGIVVAVIVAPRGMEPFQRRLSLQWLFRRMALIGLF